MTAWRKSSYSGSQGDCVEVGTEWRTSTYSGSQTQCVEVGNAWRTSSYSGSQGACIEAGSPSRVVVVRDTRDRDGATLAFGAPAWRAFAARLAAR